jgi:tyrosyl-tRNA synthetase
MKEVILNRGVSEIIDLKSLEAKLDAGKKLRIKLGIDPTSPHIHLGRATALRKLRDFQDAGHQIVFIIGDFTGVVGDTSDKDAERPVLESETVESNLKTYIEQASKIIDIDKCEIHRNSEWLSKLTFSDVSGLADEFSVNDFISRELVSKRITEGKRVSLREVLYPIMQGYDSVAIRADVEIGGTDQKFNMLAGRVLQRKFGLEPQDIIMLPLIEGLDGRKMSSSWGNGVNLMDEPNDMFGKIMSLKDDLIIKYFNVCTRVPNDEILKFEKALSEGVNPKEIKMALAVQIVTDLHGQEFAESAKKNWEETFSEGKIPEDVLDTYNYDPTKTIVEVAMESGLVSSKSEFIRLLDSSAVEHMEDKQKITDIKAIATPGTYRIGKKRFLRIK